MLVGLYGSGKTTTAGKLAKYYKKRGYKVAVVSTDTWRPAATKQLEQLAKQVGVDFYGDEKETNPNKRYDLDENKYDLIIVDTAGRDSLNEELAQELINLNEKVNADEKLLILSADIGKAAKSLAEKFNELTKISGVILTKLEGTARGGGALSACAVTNSHIKFIGTGEKIDDLEIYHPNRFASQLLGMGDLESLLEKAKEVIKEEDAEKIKDKFISGNYNLNDLYQQMEAMNKMGSLGKIIDMIPGMSQVKLPKDAIKVQEIKLKAWKVAMDSMTPLEKENPDILDADRIYRISWGSGIYEENIRELLKQYKKSKKMMKMFKNEGNLDKMMKKFKMK